LRKFLIFLILNIFLFCQDDKPKFNTELTENFTPIEGVLPYFNKEVMDPFWSKDGKLPESLRRLTGFTLLTDSGEAITDDKIIGKDKLLVFFYAKCKGICPMITRNMIDFLPKIKDKSNLLVISISVNPEEDTVEALKKYKAQYRITDNQWVFLTGAKDTIYELARKQFNADVQVVQGTQNLNDFVHTEHIYLIDKNNYLRGFYRAKGTGDLERLLIELETLQKEEKK